MPYVIEARSPGYVPVSGFGSEDAATRARHEAVRVMQQRLKEIYAPVDASMDPGEVDGVYKKQTHDALVAWLNHHRKICEEGTADTEGKPWWECFASGRLSLEDLPVSAAQIARINEAYEAWKSGGEGAEPIVLPPGAMVTTGGWFDQYWWVVALGAVAVGVYFTLRSRKMSVPVRGSVNL